MKVLKFCNHIKSTLHIQGRGINMKRWTSKQLLHYPHKTQAEHYLWTYVQSDIPTNIIGVCVCGW